MERSLQLALELVEVRIAHHLRPALGGTGSRELDSAPRQQIRAARQRALLATGRQLRNARHGTPARDEATIDQDGLAALPLKRSQHAISGLPRVAHVIEKKRIRGEVAAGQ